MLLDHALKRKEWKKIKETGRSRYICQKKLDKVCFRHDKAYGDLKDLNRRTAANKALCDKTFNIAKNSKYDGYQPGLVSTVYNIFHKKASGGAIKKDIMQNEKVAKELQKPIIIRKFEKKKYTHFL